MKLLNTQKAALFQEIALSYFKPNQFSLSEPFNEQGETTITFNETPFRLSFRNPAKRLGVQGGTRMLITMSPGDRQWEQTSHIETWEQALGTFQQWLEFLHEELNTVDPWAAISALPLPEQTVSPDADNAPFTIPQLATIRAGVSEIKTLLLEKINISDEGQTYIIATLDKLASDGEKLGKKDWFNQAVGAITSLFITFACSSDLQRSVWHILKNAVSGIVSLTPVVEQGVRHLN